MEVVVGRLGRPHGVRGEVSVELRTDEPDHRFAIGAVLRPVPSAGQARLTVTATRRHGERLLVTFAEIRDRTDAEAVRGAHLIVEVDADDRPGDPDEYYDHQLVGLSMRTTGDLVVGTVTEVQHLPGQDLLVVTGAAGTRLVPFVSALVPEVDLAAGTMVVVARPGLLDDPDPADED